MLSFLFVLATASALTPQQITSVLSLVYPGQSDPNSKPTKLPGGVLPNTNAAITATACVTLGKTLGTGFIGSCGTDLCTSTCVSKVGSILTGSSLIQLIEYCQPTLAEAKILLGNYSKLAAKCGPFTPDEIVSQYDIIFGAVNTSTNGIAQPSAGQDAVAVASSVYDPAPINANVLQAPKTPLVMSSGFTAKASMIGLFGVVYQFIL